MPKITIIDGNSLLFRAYYATAYPGVEIMRAQDGTPTNAIFAFSNMINKILNGLKTDECIMVAFDAGKDTFRKEQLESYKANRKPAPMELVVQFPIARDFLKALNIFQFEQHGFEGDDIAGTVAKMAEREGYEVVVYTSDRDFLQLVNEHITVNIIRKGLSDVVAMTPETVQETYGFAPLQIIDYKVYSLMKYESGVHRVQRVPTTEAGGRIHTSTVTVSVMPEAEEVELNINPDDLRFDVFRSSGPGGQCVNTTDSAVRVTHLPTGVSVASQQEKSQHRNKEIALRILYARLLEHKQREEAARQAADKRSQVGSGDRSERIRTYNFPQNRVTDHRFNVSSYDLPKIMQGYFELILNPILKLVCEQQLEALKNR